LEYPLELRRKHVAGTVWVDVSLDATGHLLYARVTRSVHPILDAIVLRAVRETRWKPAVKAGKAIPMIFHFPVTFGKHKRQPGELVVPAPTP
jgi:protein TonB